MTRHEEAPLCLPFGLVKMYQVPKEGIVSFFPRHPPVLFHARVCRLRTRERRLVDSVYHPYIPNWRNDELDHYIEALILAEEKGVSIYIDAVS